MNKLIDVKSIIPKAIQHFWKKIMLFINEELDWVVNLKPKKIDKKWNWMERFWTKNVDW